MAESWDNLLENAQSQYITASNKVIDLHPEPSRDNNNRCTLCRLPPEIRVKLWEQYFSNDDYYCYKKQLNSNLVAALRQNKPLKLYGEALDVYYKQTIFHMNPETFKSFKSPQNRNAIMNIHSVLYDIRSLNPNLGGYLKSLCNDDSHEFFQARELRHLTIRVWHSWMFDISTVIRMSHFLWRVLSNLENFESLDLEAVVAGWLPGPLRDKRVKHIELEVEFIARMTGLEGKFSREHLEGPTEVLRWSWRKNTLPGRPIGQDRGNWER